MTHNIMQMIVLSTGHLDWSTVQLLEHTPILSERYPVMGAPIPYGFLVYAHDDDDPGIPRDLWACCVYARKQGCDYIRFDAEEDICDDLPDLTATHRVADALAQLPPTHVATFVGEAWVGNRATPVDDGAFEFPVNGAEIEDAGGFAGDSTPTDCEPRGDWDALKGAHAAPPQVRDWTGPYTIKLRPIDQAAGGALAPADAAPADGGDDVEACRDCGEPLDEAGDGYDGRCPSCADRADVAA